MNFLEEKLKPLGIELADGGIEQSNYDYTKHIRNNIYNYLGQSASTSSFVDYFIKAKKLYFKEKRVILKRFFNGLLSFILKHDDKHKKEFYIYIFNNNVSKLVLRETYNMIQYLNNEERLKVQLKKFYNGDVFLQYVTQKLALTDLEINELELKVEKNLIYKQYISVSFANLIILELFLTRDFNIRKIKLNHFDYKQAKRSINYDPRSKNVIASKNKDDLMDPSLYIQKNKKGFSCFRFNFMPTYIKKNGKLVADERGEELSRQRIIKEEQEEQQKAKIREQESLEAFRRHIKIIDQLK